MVDEKTGEWSPRALDPDDQYTFAATSDEAAEAAERCILLHRGAVWLLVAGRLAPAVTVNGDELPFGLRALEDRDEIVINDQSIRRYFFSTETTPGVEKHPPSEDQQEPSRCPRCTQFIASGQDAVRCPACRVWHHQTSELPCWSYGETCGACHKQLTNLDAEYSFHPEQL